MSSEKSSSISLSDSAIDYLGVTCQWPLTGFEDGEIVPLICPACQVFGPDGRLRVPPLTVHGVVFDIFGNKPRRPGATAAPDGAPPRGRVFHKRSGRHLL